MTFAVDWAWNNNDLSTYRYLQVVQAHHPSHLVVVHAATSRHVQDLRQRILFQKQIIVITTMLLLLLLMIMTVIMTMRRRRRRRIIKTHKTTTSTTQIIIIIITIIKMTNFNRLSSHGHHGSAQSAANWSNTHTHVDRKHSLTHSHQRSYNHVVRSAGSAIT